MKVKGTDGKIHPWNLGCYVGNINTNASDLHERAREFLEKNFPAIQILEEVYIPCEGLYMDFYLPLKKICIECMGRQHDKFSLYMHKNKMGFAQSKVRDGRKADFCQLNGIMLIYFYPDEKEELWMSKLNIQKT